MFTSLRKRQNIKQMTPETDKQTMCNTDYKQSLQSEVEITETVNILVQSRASVHVLALSGKSTDRNPLGRYCSCRHTKPLKIINSLQPLQCTWNFDYVLMSNYDTIYFFVVCICHKTFRVWPLWTLPLNYSTFCFQALCTFYKHTHWSTILHNKLWTKAITYAE